MPPAVITIGTFDGVHVGHAALVSRARALAGPSGAKVVAMAFDPHPLTRLRPDQAPPRLSTFAQRERWLREEGADLVVPLEPTAELLGLSPADFLGRVCREWGAIAFVEGPDFRFGRGREGDVAFLRDYGARAGLAVEIVEPATIVLGDHTVAPASSTLARWLIAHGRVADAAVLLGRSYECEGMVVRGDRRGRTIGFPTANLRTGQLLPADGVYAAEARLDDGRVFPAAASVGTKPTFGPGERAVEAFLLDAETDGPVLAGLPEYGWNLRLGFTAWVREQVRFPSVEALAEQMHRDCARIRAMVPAPELRPGATAGAEALACP